MSAFLAWFHYVCDVIVCDTYRPCATWKDQRVLLYTDRRVPEQNLAVACTGLPGAHSTSGGVGKRTVCLEKGMAEVLIGRRPAQSEAEAGQGSWYPSVTCCYFLQQHIFIGCCTQDLILHSEMGLAAASSPLASILSGKKVCLILFSFLLLHSFRGEQASSPPFPIGKRRFRHGWWVRFACEVVVGQSLSVNLFSVTHCIIKGQNGICKV